MTIGRHQIAIASASGSRSQRPRHRGARSADEAEHASTAARTSRPVRRTRTPPPKRSPQPASSSIRKPSTTTRRRRPRRPKCKRASRRTRHDDFTPGPSGRAGRILAAAFSPEHRDREASAVAVVGYSTPSVTRKPRPPQRRRPDVRGLITRGPSRSGALARRRRAADPACAPPSAPLAPRCRGPRSGGLQLSIEEGTVTPPWNSPCCCNGSSGLPPVDRKRARAARQLG